MQSLSTFANQVSHVVNEARSTYIVYINAIAVGLEHNELDLTALSISGDRVDMSILVGFPPDSMFAFWSTRMYLSS